MEILLANSSLDTPGGSETYLVTVALQLQRLGHGVTLFGHRLGKMADLARGHGLRVTGSLDGSAHRPDVALVQDSVVSYELAEHWPGMPQLFRASSEVYDFQLPPSLPGVVDKVIVLSDRVAARVRATGHERELVRLRQPVDTERFKPLSPIREVPRQAVLLGNYLSGSRRAQLLGALADRGVAVDEVGSNGRTSLDPERAISRADIVIAKGRAAVEGMACGRAVLVYDEFGSDGWITPEHYPAMEADNFAGQATDTSTADLAAELDRYSPEMGVLNRDVALRHHGARYHVNQLCELLAAARSPERAGETPMLALARLARLQWQTETRFHGLERALRELESERRELESNSQAVTKDRDRLETILGMRRHRIASAVGRAFDRAKAAARR